MLPKPSNARGPCGGRPVARARESRRVGACSVLDVVESANRRRLLLAPPSDQGGETQSSAARRGATCCLAPSAGQSQGALVEQNSQISDCYT
jgi:hypothetical protein